MLVCYTNFVCSCATAHFSGCRIQNVTTSFWKSFIKRIWVNKRSEWLIKSFRPVNLYPNKTVEATHLLEDPSDIWPVHVHECWLRGETQLVIQEVAFQTFHYKSKTAMRTETAYVRDFINKMNKIIYVNAFITQAGVNFPCHIQRRGRKRFRKEAQHFILHRNSKINKFINAG